MWHAAGLGIDTATSEQYIAVTGGLYYDSGTIVVLDSVEILYSGETKWQTGKHSLALWSNLEHFYILKAYIVCISEHSGAL